MLNLVDCFTQSQATFMQLIVTLVPFYMILQELQVRFLLVHFLFLSVLFSCFFCFHLLFYCFLKGKARNSFETEK